MHPLSISRRRRLHHILRPFLPQRGRHRHTTCEVPATEPVVHRQPRGMRHRNRWQMEQKHSRLAKCLNSKDMATTNGMQISPAVLCKARLARLDLLPWVFARQGHSIRQSHAGHRTIIAVGRLNTAMHGQRPVHQLQLPIARRRVRPG